jgi:hypothetical protein
MIVNKDNIIWKTHYRFDKSGALEITVDKTQNIIWSSIRFRKQEPMALGKLARGI